MGRESYVPHRGVLYGLLWVFAVIELGLTGYRIRHTKHNFSFYDPIIAELLVASILTILWVPVTLLIHRASFGSSNTGSNSRGFGLLHGETFGNFVLWIFWLVGAAIATHKWPTRSLAGPGKQGSILLTIIAFAWMIFALLTLAKVLGAMEYAARNAVGSGRVGPDVAREKPANSATGTGATTGNPPTTAPTATV